MNLKIVEIEMNKFTLSRLTSGLLLAALAVGAQAAEVTKATDMVKGRVPVAGLVSITNQTSSGVPPEVGHVLEVEYSFTDADGDAENGTVIEWRRGSTVIATTNTYTIQNADVGKSITAQVTPKTNPEYTEPFSGAPVVSAAVSVERGIGSFTHNQTQRTWVQADGYCKSLGNGARLPTVAELKKLFVSATSATVADGSQSNSEMCGVHKWCSGGTNRDHYWTLDTALNPANGSYTHVPVYMVNGQHFPAFRAEAQPLPTACVR
jgi:hypothetical protein